MAAHWLMHAFAPARPEGAMVSEAGHHALSAAPLCAACASMMLLLLVLLTARPAVALGFELAERLGAVPVPRPPTWYAPWRLRTCLEPELARPPILATGHCGRAPPRPAIGLA